MNENSSSSSGSGRLLESLWQDARREAGQNLTRARARADKLLSDIQDHREQTISQARERAREEASAEIARILNRARSTVEKATLGGRYGFIEDCLDKANRILKDNVDTTESVRSSFDSLFHKAAQHFDRGDKLLVTISPVDLEAARTLVTAAELECTIIPEPGTLGGVRIETADGSRVVDNTVAARLETLAENLPVELLKMTLPDTGHEPDLDEQGEFEG
jgi:vacuolar-type H+-ATPase subunit E/Vma4